MARRCSSRRSLPRRRAPEVQLQRAILRLEAQAPLPRRQVPRQRDHGGRVGHGSHRGADHQGVVDQDHGRRATFAEHGGRGLRHLAQAGEGAQAKRGQGVGQAGGIDDLGGRCRMPAGPQHRRDLAEPSGYDLRTGVDEQVVVPAGRLDARPVARGRGQAPAGPRHPGHHHLGLRQVAEHCRVLGRAACVEVRERRDVPGAAHDGRPLEALLGHRPQALAHVRLAVRLPAGGGGPVLAHGGHGLRNRVEDIVGSMLHQVIPPALDVIEACRGGQLAQRIALRVGTVLGAGRHPRLSQ